MLEEWGKRKRNRNRRNTNSKVKKGSKHNITTTIKPANKPFQYVCAHVFIFPPRKIPSHAINTNGTTNGLSQHETNNTRNVTQCHQATESTSVQRDSIGKPIGLDVGKRVSECLSMVTDRKTESNCLQNKFSSRKL